MKFELLISLTEWREVVENNFVYETEDIYIDLKEDKNVTVKVSHPDGKVKAIDMAKIN